MTGFHSECLLVRLPADMATEVRSFLPSVSCGTLRAASKSVGCYLISEDYLTAHIDRSTRERGLDGVMAVAKRHKTTLAYLRHCLTAAWSTLVDVDSWLLVAWFALGGAVFHVTVTLCRSPLLLMYLLKAVP
mmetsp:Transcript_9369/g.22954  ORF Transcript_9369/g.22954 Transcript_9369/m.22954 type:complete len:132 (-) Transcript_9369:13-408(-)